MTAPNNNSCVNRECLSNVALGTGNCLGMTGSALAITVIALLVAAVAAGALFYDGMFVYTYAVTNPVQLAWAIPAAILFVVVDCLIVGSIVRCVSGCMACLATQTANCARDMKSHYGALIPSRQP